MAHLRWTTVNSVVSLFSSLSYIQVKCLWFTWANAAEYRLVTTQWCYDNVVNCFSSILPGTNLTLNMLLIEQTIATALPPHRSLKHYIFTLFCSIYLSLSFFFLIKMKQSMVLECLVIGCSKVFSVNYCTSIIIMLSLWLCFPKMSLQQDRIAYGNMNRWLALLSYADILS